MGMLPLKAVVVSTGVVSLAVILKLPLPVILDFLTSELPLFWSLALSWLRPPYMYLLINCIIISIVASSKLQPRGGDGNAETLVPAPASFPVADSEDVHVAVMEVAKEDDVVVFGYVDSPIVTKMDEPVKVVGGGSDDVEEREKFEDGDEFVLSKPVWNSPEKCAPVVVPEFSPVSSAEKPSFSARFGHRRAVKASPEGKAVLKVSRPKKQETLESTWRTITEGRSMPLTRHLKKSDTFAGASPEESPVKVMKKSDTFNNGRGSASPASASSRLRREPSLSQDELNRRVEAFIKKFNEEMRLQRQDSLNQYKEVVSRGSH
ncbi:uncharacterized protein LOC110693202 [Chenopodium quinoa]|uniref:DUF4408 domain-containing protein n=1 Tax=Chenopodium quinoa TaxID=63459 RepID=A0A803MH62_CHEQI|nr:uncharacterized protein LOC110693202 [Chenopodium quinoa]